MVTNCDHLVRLKYSAALPWAFTEHGAIMAAAVLNSPRAVEMSVFVVRAFVRLRDIVRNHGELAKQLDALERRVTAHDKDLEQVLVALRQLLEVPAKARRQIGFGGLQALAAERRGEQTLRSHTIEQRPAPAVTPRQLVELREELNLSRALFAVYLRTNVRTLENWEQGRAKPNAQASLLIRLVERYPDTVQRLAAI